jgi:hypothetical protein
MEITVRNSTNLGLINSWVEVSMFLQEMYNWYNIMFYTILQTSMDMTKIDAGRVIRFTKEAEWYKFP